MAFAIVQTNEGIGTTATVTPTFSVAPTSGNLVGLAFGAGDYNGTPNAWATQSTGMEQQAFLGGYFWWQISNGVNSFPYTVGSAVNSAWVLMEFSGHDASPYDISAGTFANGGIGPPYPNIGPSITPTSGNRLLLAVFVAMNSGGENNDIDPDSWTNSFTLIRTSGSTGSGERHHVTVGYRTVAANGSTAYSTQVSYSNSSANARVGLIIAFKQAAAVASTSTRGRSAMASMGKWMGN